MSQQRKMRSELKQGLHQFLMSLYHSYLQSMSHEDALEQIATCLNEEYQYFTKKAIHQENELNLESYIKKLEKLAKTERHPDKKHEIYQDAEALLHVQDILLKYDLSEDLL